MNVNISCFKKAIIEHLKPIVIQNLKTIFP